MNSACAGPTLNRKCQNFLEGWGKWLVEAAKVSCPQSVWSQLKFREGNPSTSWLRRQVFYVTIVLDLTRKKNMFLECISFSYSFHCFSLRVKWLLTCTYSLFRFITKKICYWHTTSVIRGPPFCFEGDTWHSIYPYFLHRCWKQTNRHATVQRI